MEAYDDLLQEPDEEGRVNMTHRGWVMLDEVVWSWQQSLLFLDVSFNDIEVLPPQLGNLILLRELCIECNKLEVCYEIKR